MEYERAVTLASGLLAALAPSCHRIEVAGSVRRRKADVKDIELVAIPRWADRPVDGQALLFDAEGGLFEEPVESVNLLQEAVQDLADAGRLSVIKPNVDDVVAWHLEPQGRYWRLYLPRHNLKIDLFLATPETWGLVFTIRTGSAEFARAMLARWKQVSGGGYSQEARLWRPGARSPERTPEEDDVFRLCQVTYVPPDQRGTYRAMEDHALPITDPRALAVPA